MRLLLPVLAGSFLFSLGCGKQPAGNNAVDLRDVHHALATMHSEPDKVRAADYSILFLGNSHTIYHGVPSVVARMIEHANPGKKAYTHIISVAFLEQVGDDSRLPEEIDDRQWKYVVLQGQKISSSGRNHYSQKGGIDFAKRAKARGAQVIFFSEWGRKDVPGDGDQQEKIYQQMAAASGVRVAPIGRAWDLALSKQPQLPLHDHDGNHESALGAYLTACTLYGTVTGKSPAELASFPYAHGSDADRILLAECAASILEQDAAKTKR